MEVDSSSSVVGLGKVFWTLHSAADIVMDMVGEPERGFVEYTVGEFHNLMPLIPLEDFSMQSGQPVVMMKEVLSFLKVLDSTGAAVSAFDFLHALPAESLWLIPITRQDYERVGQGGGFLKAIGLGSELIGHNLFPSIQ